MSNSIVQNVSNAVQACSKPAQSLYNIGGANLKRCKAFPALCGTIRITRNAISYPCEAFNLMRNPFRIGANRLNAHSVRLKAAADRPKMASVYEEIFLIPIKRAFEHSKQARAAKKRFRNIQNGLLYGAFPVFFKERTNLTASCRAFFKP